MDFRNPVNSLDVSNDGFISPIDPLQVINELNLVGSHALGGTRPAANPFWDTSGDNFISPLDALQVINALNAGQTVPYLLTEGERFAAEQSVTITVGQTAGTRTYRLQVTPNFDVTDTAASSRDLFAIYLVDPQQPDQTLLDRGTPGTTLFTLSESGAEFVPGRVRWDGKIVEIDLSEVNGRDTAELRLQLLSNDGDVRSRVSVQPLSNLVDPEGVSSPMLLDTTTPSAAGAAFNFTGVPAANDVAVLVENVRFNSATQRFAAELRLQNQGGSLGRSIAVAFSDLPSGVTLRNSSGTTADGNPYVNFAPAIQRGGLSKNSRSERLLVEFENPGDLPFTISPQIIAAANQPPTLSPIGPLTVMPGGKLVTQLAATDPDGDAVAFSLSAIGSASASSRNLPTGILRGNGVLEFAPTSDQLGQYIFDVIASDGTLESRQTITLNVVSDTNTATRLSGQVVGADGNALEGVPIALDGLQTMTAADGTFILDAGAGGPLPGDVLTIDGSALAGTVPFPQIRVQVALLLGRAVYEGANNTIFTPLVLSPLDVAGGTQVTPAQAQTLTQPLAAGGSAGLQLVANTVKDGQGQPFSEVLSLTEVSLDAPPIPLPDTLFPDLAVMVAPANVTFTAPAALTLPNRAGFAPGAMLDLWALDPATGLYVDRGDATVSANGNTIATTVGGAVTGGLHFFALKPVTPQDLATNVLNLDVGGFEQAQTAPLTSEVELHSGAVLETHDLVTYQSLGETRGLSLRYDSLRADPRPIIAFGFPAIDPAAIAGLNRDRLRMTAQLAVRRGDFEIRVPGFTNAPQYGLQGDEHFWSLPADGGKVDAALQVDLTGFPSGVYEYELMLGVRLFDDAGQRLVGSATRQTGRILHVNTVDSPLGHGWSFAGVQQIVENPDGSALLIDGDGSELLFRAPATAGGAYGQPTGDFSTLEKVDDGAGNQVFQRTMTDQMVYTFDVQGQLVSMRDRNNNDTRWEYDFEGRLVKMIDPVNLETTLTYSGVTVEIRDPANRLTKLDLDASGNLQRITDPDDAQRTFGYDTARHMTSEITPRGFTEETYYGFHGRATGGQRKDKTVVQVAPVQTKALAPPEKTSIPFTAPSSNVLSVALLATVAGNLSETDLDQLGQALGGRDNAGCLVGEIQRDDANLPQVLDTCLSNRFVVTYDENGNPIALRDKLSGAVLTGDPQEPILFPGSAQGLFKVGRWNDDNFADVAARRNTDIEILLANGDRTFRPGPTIEGDRNNTEEGTVRVDSQVAFDLNGDGVLDLVNLERLLSGVNCDGSPSASISFCIATYLNDGQGNFARRATPIIAPEASGSDFDPNMFHVNETGFGDIDGDGDLDLIVQGYFFGFQNNYDWVLVLRNENGVLASATTGFSPLPDDQVGETFAVGDIDGDGNDDLAMQVHHHTTLGSPGVQVLLSDGAGGFTPGTFLENVGRFARVLGDFNGDGRSDLVTSDLSLDPNLLSGVAVHLNTGDGNFGAPTVLLSNVSTNFVLHILTGDVNNDGRTDLVLGNRAGQSNALRVFLGNGNGSFAEPFEISLGPADRDLLRPALADMDGDGDPDYVAWSRIIDGATVDGVIGVQLNDGMGHVVSALAGEAFIYDPDFNQPIRRTDELGHVTIREIDPLNGNRLAERRVTGIFDTAENGETDDVVMTFTYTPQGLVDTETNSCGCAGTLDNDYDEFGRLIRVTYALGTPDEATRSFEYDAAGNVISETDENGAVTRMAYDAMNRVKVVTTADPDGETGPLLSLVTMYDYDEAGNRTTTTDVRGNVTVEAYDPLDRLVRRTDPDPDGAGPLVSPVTKFGYDLTGNLNLTTDPRGNETRRLYDVRDRLIEITDPEGGITRYEYDVNNNQTALIDPELNRTAWTYDERNRKLTETDPLGKVITWEYDAADNIKSMTDREGRVIRYEYDELDRLTTETWEVNESAPANVIRTTYDNRSNRLTITDNFSKFTYTYDARNRVKTVDNAGTPSAPHVVLSYAYDDVGQVLSVTDTIDGEPGGVNVYAYDALRRPTQITQAGSGVSDKRVDFTYDAEGLLRSLDRYSDLAGTQAVIGSTYGFDELNRLTSLVHNNGDADIAFYNLVYDVAGRITRIADTDGTRNFTYDETDQLTGASHTASNVPDEEFDYDANGNRIGVQTGPGNRLLSDGTFDYEYDDEGNLVLRTRVATAEVREFTWDHRNRLLSVVDKDAAGVETQVVRFTYDAMNRRIAKSVDITPTDAVDAAITYFVYDREDVLLDFLDDDGDGPNPPVQALRYLHGSGYDQVFAQENFLEQDASLRVLWLLPDYLGSTRDLADNDGAVRNHIIYDAFGRIVFQSNPDVKTRYLFSGREFDEETGLYFYRARYYDPVMKRFLSEDPTRFAAGDINLYRYVNNDPLRFTDPTGTGRLPYIVFQSSRDASEKGHIYVEQTNWRPDDPDQQWWLPFILDALATDRQGCDFTLQKFHILPAFGDEVSVRGTQIIVSLTKDAPPEASPLVDGTCHRASVEWVFITGLGLVAAARLMEDHRKRRRRKREQAVDAILAEDEDLSGCDA